MPALMSDEHFHHHHPSDPSQAPTAGHERTGLAAIALPPARGNSREQRVERRRDNVAIAFKLRQENPDLSLRQIAELLGVAYGTAKDYFFDPDGSKAAARKDSYRGTCQSCGQPTSGGEGPNSAKALCQRCKGVKIRKWSPERVLEVLRAFEQRFGFPATSYDLNPTVAARRGGQALERYNAFRLPASVVVRLFGTFRAAALQAYGDGYDDRLAARRARERAARRNHDQSAGAEAQSTHDRATHRHAADDGWAHAA